MENNTEKGLKEIGIGVPSKFCKTCGISKQLSDFPANKSCLDGTEGSCKKCRNRRVKLSNLSHPNTKPLPTAEFTIPDAEPDEAIPSAFEFRENLNLEFDKADTHILIALKKLAKAQRRTPEQQALWILEERIRFIEGTSHDDKK